MNASCKVSLYCTAYNHENYIRQALDSFLAQKTDFPFEVLVTDDASTDSTPAILREYTSPTAASFSSRQISWIHIPTIPPACTTPGITGVIRTGRMNCLFRNRETGIFPLKLLSVGLPSLFIPVPSWSAPKF